MPAASHDTPDQDGRQLLLETPLGNDVLLPTHVTLNEQINGPAVAVVKALAESGGDFEPGIDPNKLLGNEVSIRIAPPPPEDGDFRYPDKGTHFRGIVTRFSLGETGLEAWGAVRHYELEINAAPWLLRQTRNSRVFQQMSIKEIVAAVFDGYGAWRLKHKFEAKSKVAAATLDYCVQYQETDLNFVLRLLEATGLYLYVRHDDKKSEVVVAEHLDGAATASPDELPVLEIGEAPEPGEEAVIEFLDDAALRAGSAVARDYHFQMADRELNESAQSTYPHADKKLERLLYPGLFAGQYNTGAAGVEGTLADYAALAADKAGRPRGGGRGKSTSPGLRPGHVVRLSGSINRRAKESRLVTSVVHTAEQYPPYSADRVVETPYLNTFVAVQADEKEPKFRPARTVRQPYIAGVQSATVTGPSGQEIHTDQYGRVKVQFPWDREGEGDDTTSCWVRVAQMTAGPKWGGHVWPRVGEEVLVAFIEGDPDAPIVVGSVYNSRNMPPYALPDGQTRSGWKSRSTPNGKADQFNEFRFEDAAGKEEIFLHAQKDLNEVVVNDHAEKIEEGSRTVEVAKGDDTLTVGQGDRTAELGRGNDALTLKKGDRKVELTLGSDTLDVKAGKRSVKAMQGIELAVGPNKITISPSGIKIEGLMVTVQGSAKADLKAPMVEVNGAGMLKAGGGITMLG
jgi:type VI secretion system secreted protein VgrG